MNDNSVDSLILELAESLETRPLYKPMKYLVPLMLGVCGYVLFSMYFIHLRGDVSSLLSSPSFIFEIILALLIAIFAIISSTWLQIPDRGGNTFFEYSTWTLCSIFTIWILVHSALDDIGPLEFHLYKCVTDGLIIVTIPILAMVLFSRKGHTTHPLKMAYLNYISVAALCWAALRFTCGNDLIGHVLLYHFLPFTIIGVTLGVLARKIYRW